MKLLIVLSIFIIGALSQIEKPGEVLRHCLNGDADDCPASPDCNGDDGNKCPNACKKCRDSSKQQTKITVITCPDRNRPHNGKKPDACRKFDWNNENGHSNIYLYERPDGSGFDGIDPENPRATIFGMGDIKNFVQPEAYAISHPTKTKETFAEANINSANFPVSRSMIHQVSAPNLVRSKSLNQALNPDRRALPKDTTAAFVIRLLLVFDSKFKNHLKGEDKAKAELKSMQKMLEPAYYHESLRRRIEFEHLDPVYYPANLTADLKGYQQVISTKDGPKFDFNKYGKMADVIIFNTHTDPTNPPPDFSLEIGVQGGICSTAAQGVGIAEYIFSALVSAHVLVRVIGVILNLKLDNDRTLNGKPCLNKESFMDTHPFPKGWSHCSIEDFERSVKDGHLACLKKKKCPKDYISICPNTVKKNDGACNVTWVAKKCPASCDVFCSGLLLAYAKLPDNFVCTNVCEDKPGHPSFCKNAKCGIALHAKICPKTCNQC